MLLAALLLAGALQLSVALFGWSDAAASNQRVLSVTAEPAVIPARGGESTITVRLPASAANGETRVTLSTQLGVFTVLTGPSEIRHDLSDMGDDTLGAAVMLIADGHSGSTVVRAQVGSLVNTVTVHFVGETTSLRLEQPGPNARLDASRAHRVQLVASDETGLGAPRAEVALEITAAPAGATLRSGTQSSTTSLTLRADRFGKVSTLLTSPPGTVRLRARSDNASLDLELSLYGPPHTLRLVAIEGDSLERGQPGLIQALLLDEMGQGVPNQQIVFSAVGNLQIDREGADEPVTTDASGAARVHLDTANARLGVSQINATWIGANQRFSDALDLRITGPPAAMHLAGEISYDEVSEAVLEEFRYSTRYRIEARIVDELGQPVAGSYRVRWRALITDADAHVYPQVSVTEDGVATTIFDLQHIDGAPQPERTKAQAWLIDRAQVNNLGRISDLLGDGLLLRRGFNRLSWQGPAMPISEAVDSIRHTVLAAWHQTDAGVWQAWFNISIPGSVDFMLQPGDRLYLELSSAATLPQVARD